MGREFRVLYTHGVLGKRRPRRWIGKAGNSFQVLTRDRTFFMCFLPNKGFFLSGWCPHDARGFIGWKPHVRYEVPDMKKRSAKGTSDEGNHRAPVESNVFRDLMPLVEHAALTKYDDGDPREPGWITIKTQGRAWIVQVKDPDAGVSFQALGETLDKALETAALLLGCDEAPWEHDQWLTRKAASKKKK